jgi:hypothetical protein
MSTAAYLQAASAKPALSSHSLNDKLLQRKCACGSSKSPLSEMCDNCQSRILQRKLAIGASNDPLEQEADRAADQVMAAPAHPAIAGAPPRIQRYTGQASEDTDTAPASVEQALASPGRPLEPALRQNMERRFGHDFSRVRVHTGSTAEKSVQDMGAQAYTVGHNIVFGAAQPSLGGREGQRLLAHELSHVVQQEGGSRKLGEAQSSLSAVPNSYAQRQPQIPKFSQSTEDEIAKLMKEHPGLSRVNAERAIQGPPGSVPEVSGTPRATGTESANMPKVPDITFRQPTTHGSSVLLRREVKVLQGAQGRFNARVSEGTSQLIAAGDTSEFISAGGGGELLVQVPKGTNARLLVDQFKKAGNLPPEALAQRLGRYRSIKITIVDPSGNVLLDEFLEFPPSTISPTSGGGERIVPVAPSVKTAPGEIITGKPTGVTASGGGERIVPVAPSAQTTPGEIITGKPTGVTASGGGERIVPVAPSAQTATGEFITGKPTGVTASGGGERMVPVAPSAQTATGETITGEVVPPKPTGEAEVRGAAKPVTTTPTAAGGTAFGVRLARGVRIVGGQILLFALQVLGTWLKGHVDELHIRHKIEQYEPIIMAEIQKRADEVAHIQVNGGKAFGNVTIFIRQVFVGGVSLGLPMVGLVNIDILGREVNVVSSSPPPPPLWTASWFQTTKATYSFEVKVFTDEELKELDSLSERYLEYRRMLLMNPGSIDLQEQTRITRETIVEKFGTKVWLL